MPVSVNDDYWLTKAKTLVEESDTHLNTAVTSLTTYITWAFPIYTASSVFTIAYNQVGIWWAVLFSLPYVLLFWSYWKVIQVSDPQKYMLDPRVPHLIANTYAQSRTEKLRRLKSAQGLTGVSMALLALLLSMSFVLKNSYTTNDPQALQTKLATHEGQNHLTIDITLPGVTSADISIETAHPRDTTYFYQRYLKKSNHQETFNVSTANECTVTISWKESDVSKTMQRDVKLLAATP